MKKRKSTIQTIVLFVLIFIVLGGTYLIRLKESKSIENKISNLDEKTSNFFINKEFKEYRGKSFYVEKENPYMNLKEMSKLLGYKYKEKKFKDQAIIKNGKKTLTIDYKEKNIVENGKKVSVIQKNHMYLVKMKDILEEFNENISYLKNEDIYRIKKNDSKTLNIELLKKHEDKTGIEVKNYRQKYEKEKYIFEKKNPDLKIKTKMEEIPNKKIVYLTFDDGPNECTNEIIDVLNEFGIKGTFFTLGYNIIGKEDIVKKAYNTGHTIGLHGVSHKVKNVYASPESFLNEMEENNKILENTIGIRSKLVRPPYGSKPWLNQSFRDLLYNNGYRVWDWNVDSKDYPKTSTPIYIVNTVKNQIDFLDGHPIVVLFHDKRQTLNGLRDIIEYLKMRGYEFGEITENLYPMNFWEDKRIKE